MNKSTGVVLGTFGVERHLLRFVGQAAHSGSTPIPMRRDAFLAAAESALGFREIARKHTTPTARVVCTVGTVKVEPGIVTAVPGVCEISLDQRALDAESPGADAGRCPRGLVQGGAARTTSPSNGNASGASIRGRSIRSLIALCADAVREVTGDAPLLPSGPLHDAAEMVPHMPVVMMFAYSSNGLSHCKEEDTPSRRICSRRSKRSCCWCRRRFTWPTDRPKSKRPGSMSRALFVQSASNLRAYST